MYQQQPLRRRKKRHTQGMKIVELNRGKSGYGFTISGQHPCILSSIVGGSPADKTGLKMGDLLIAVNNKDVSQSSHDDVVRLIGSSRGLLILQIAENFNSSESSEDEFQTRPRSKYPNRNKMRNVHSKLSMDDTVLYSRDKGRQRDKNDPLEQARLRALSPGREFERRHYEKYDRQHHDMRGMGIENIDPGSGALLNIVSNSNLKRVSNNDGIIRYRSPNTKHTIITREARLGMAKAHSQGDGVRAPSGIEMSHLPAGYHRAVPRRLPPAPGLDGADVIENDEDSILLGDYLRVIVGYVGTVGMARDSKNDATRMQSIRNAVHRLKVERKMTTMVLMELAGNGVRLINTMGSTVALYTAQHIAFSGIHSDDKRYFGIVTIHIENAHDAEVTDDEVSDSSCHVFKVNPELCQHNLHIHKVSNFGIHCTIHPETHQCMEFPQSALPILRCMSHLYKERPSALYESEMAQIGAFSRPNYMNRNDVSMSSEGGTQMDSQHRVSINTDRVCVVEVSKDNAQNFDNSFQWETSRTRLSTTHGQSIPHKKLDPNISPIHADSGLNTMERLNIRAMPDPVIDPNVSRISHRSDDGDLDSMKSSDSQSGAEINIQRLSRNDFHNTTLRSMNNSTSSLRNESSSGNQQTSHNNGSSITDTSGSGYDTTPTITPNSSIWSRPLPRPPSYPSRPVPPPPGANNRNSQPMDADKPPVPERQPIIPRRAPKTPLKPPKSSRPKSTPPFKELHIIEAEGDQSGYESEPGSVMETEDVPTNLIATKPPPRIPRTRGEGHRFSEGYVLSRRREKVALEVNKKSGSFRQATDKPFRRQTLSSSHESLVIAKDEQNNSYQGNNTSRLNGATSVTTISNKGVVTTGHCNGTIETVGRAASWAVSFDKLLHDELGLDIFREFLKKEFSEENIIFWKACEGFRKTVDPDERKKVAKELFERHLAPQATDPVNVDSAARSLTQELLADAPVNTFEVAQSHIGRLMKQDSYVRFLKSDGYKECVMLEMEGKSIRRPSTSTDDSNNNNNPPIPAPRSTPNDKWRKTLKKSKSSTSTAEDVHGEEKRRRSLLPWNKNKGDKKLPKMSTDGDLRRGVQPININKGRASLDLADLNAITKQMQGALQEVDPKNVSAKESHKFCRVILPDSSTTVILATSGRNISQAMQELCDRRQLILQLIHIELAGDTQALDMSRDLSSLASRQIILDKLVLFRLDLPNRHYMCVRAKSSLSIASVFKPIMANQGLELDSNMVVHVAGTGVILNETQNISSLEFKQVIVQSLDDFKEWGSHSNNQKMMSQKPPVPKSRTDPFKQANTLLELVNLLFLDYLEAASANLEEVSIQFDETGAWDASKFKSDEQRGSGILGFIRRNSIGEKEGNKTKAKATKMFSSVRQNKPQGVSTQLSLPPPAPPIVRGRGRFDADDLRFFELLSRAQSRQMDDQRGLTASDLELPEFLRVDSQEAINGSQTARESRSNPIEDDDSRPKSAPTNRKFMQQTEIRTDLSVPQEISDGTMTPRTAKFAMGHESFTDDGEMPTPSRATNYFMNQDLDNSRITELSLGDLGMTSDMQSQGQSYSSYVSQPGQNSGNSPNKNSQNGPQPRPQVPKRRNPPNGMSSGSSSERSKGRMSSDDDLDITLIPPSDSSGDEAHMPSPPNMNALNISRSNQVNYTPPAPIAGESMFGRASDIVHPAFRPDSTPNRSLIKHTSHSRLIACHVPTSSVSSASSRDSDMDFESIDQSGSRSTPSPTTHDLIFDGESGSECGSLPVQSMPPPQAVPRRTNPPHYSQQMKAKKSLFDGRDLSEKVQVSFV